MTALGITSGMVLNLIDSEPTENRLPWTDPVVLSTFVMFGWLIVSAVIGVFYRPAREGHRVAILTVLSFLFLLVALGMILFADTQHGGYRGEAKGKCDNQSFRLCVSGLHQRGGMG